MPNREYLQPLRDELRGVEQEITKLEGELTKLRAERTRLSRGLTTLDPTWAAAKVRSPKTKASVRADGRYPISDEKLEAVVSYLRQHLNDGTPFAQSEIPLEKIGMSDATRIAALNELARRGNLRVDRAKSHGRAKLFAVTRLPDE